MPFDDFHVERVAEHLRRRFAKRLHQIDAEGKIGGFKNRDGSGILVDEFYILRRKTRGGKHDTDMFPLCEFEAFFKVLRGRKIDHHVDGLGNVGKVFVYGNPDLSWK